MTNESAKFEILKASPPPPPPFASHEVISVKMHSTDSRFVIGPSKILIAGVYVSTFQPRNLTSWGQWLNEGVNFWLKCRRRKNKPVMNCWGIIFWTGRPYSKSGCWGGGGFLLPFMKSLLGELTAVWVQMMFIINENYKWCIKNYA